MRPAQRIPLPAAQAPAERHVCVHHTLHDADSGDPLERLQPCAPDLVLEGCLRNGRHARAEQQFKHAEEDRQGSHRQLVTRPWHEAGGGVDHAFLDLVPADRRAACRPRDPVRQRGLPRAHGAADHDKHRKRGRAHRAHTATMPACCSGTSPWSIHLHCFRELNMLPHREW
jgi:hypothetical protein